MTDRRRFPRYVFLGPLGGRARTVGDCVVDQWSGDQAELKVAQPVSSGDEYILRVTSSSGDPASYTARVISSTPTSEDGGMRFKLRVAVSPRSSSGDDSVP